MATIELYGRINNAGKLEIDLPEGLPEGSVKLVIEVDSDHNIETSTPKRSLLGLLSHLGPAPSAEDIDEVRRAMMKNFPRDDIA